MSTANNLREAPEQDGAQKEKHDRLSKRGAICLGIGVFLMILSFGINFVFFHSQGSFTSFMYILTSAGAVFIMKGLVDILGF